MRTYRPMSEQQASDLVRDYATAIASVVGVDARVVLMSLGMGLFCALSFSITTRARGLVYSASEKARPATIGIRMAAK